MSEVNEADTSRADCCASCGIEEKNDVKLKNCTACYLVKYCGIECQKAHRKQHKRECKKRAAELRDELLFKQPESSYLGDCPICMVPLLLDLQESSMMSCCSKLICKGCVAANQEREEEARVDKKCPFCRNPLPKTLGEAEKLALKRIEANDPVAMCHEGRIQSKKGDFSRAFEYFTKAAGLGDIGAHFELSVLYRDGQGVEKDKRKEIYHMEEAALGGHPDARLYLGFKEWQDGNNDRASRHWITAAAQGEDKAIKLLTKGFNYGFVDKDVLDASLRAHKAAIDATKSPQREAAEKFYRERVYKNSI